MSGIAAIIRTDGGPSDQVGIDRMAQAMAGKGPDGLDTWSGDGASLAHATLHTTAEALSSSQPFVSSDGQCAIIMDGLLFNNEELRRDLIARGMTLRTQSDCELILAAYRIWGSAFAKRCDGEFAFLLWDSVRKRALCARDHQGLRPLFYYKDKGRVIIASDLRTLNAGLGYKPPANAGYLAQMAASQFYAADQTASQGVFRVLPAHTYQISNQGIVRDRYWSLSTEVTIRYRRDEDYIEHYREVLADSVRRASRTHRPLALEVSGGLDSSSTFCLAHVLREDGRLLASDIRGYTLLGEAGSEADEIDFARAAARFVKGALCEVPLFEPSLDWFVAQASKEQDLPSYPNGAMSIGLEQKMVADGCRVSLGGTGGDQWLDGTFDYYLQQLRSLEFGEFANSIRRDVPAHGAWFTLAFAARQMVAALLPVPLANRMRRHKQGSMYGDPRDCYWLSQSAQDGLKRGFSGLAKRYKKDPVAERKRVRLERAEMQVALDLMNRQHSQLHLESRSPMLSRAFIEFSASTPEHIRFRGGQTKWVHRQAMAGILPPAIIERETKAYFPARHLTSEAVNYCKRHSPVLSRGICEQSGLEKMLTLARDHEFDLSLANYLWGCCASAAFLNVE